MIYSVVSNSNFSPLKTNSIDLNISDRANDTKINIKNNSIENIDFKNFVKKENTNLLVSEQNNSVKQDNLNVKGVNKMIIESDKKEIKNLRKEQNSKSMHTQLKQIQLTTSPEPLIRNSNN